MNSYLKLNAAETRIFTDELDALPRTEKEPLMFVTNEWTEKGMHDKAIDIVLRLLNRRFGTIPDSFKSRIENLPTERVTDLAEDLLDFTTLADADEWLTRHS